jgi:hypothetical protein
MTEIRSGVPMMNVMKRGAPLRMRKEKGGAPGPA